MIAKIRPDEVPQALEQNNQNVVYVVDADGQTTHVLMPIGDVRRMLDEYLRRELQVGIDEAARGESTDWNADEFLERAHGQHGKRRSGSRRLVVALTAATKQDRYHRMA